MRTRNQCSLMAMLCMLSHGAFAAMPTLTPMPKLTTPPACEKWAAGQDRDAIEMWGVQENGFSSRDLALRRLTLSCLGDAPPEIVGFGSSVGFNETYCSKHSQKEICKKHARVQATFAMDIKGCFARDYDKAHLAKHPDQLVTNVKLLVKDAAANAPEKLEYTLELKLRGRHDALRTTGFCREKASGYSCSVECDGGGVDVQPRGSFAMMYLDRIRMGTCGVQATDPILSEEVKGGIDDREFRIDRVASYSCGNLK